MAETETKEPKSKVQPFTVEADTARNGDLLLQAIPGQRLRGAISATKHVIDKRSGEALIPVDQARHLGQLPPIPGQRIKVDPAKGEYEISDPLYDNEELCDRIKRTMEMNSPFSTGEKLKGVESRVGKLDVHRMKNLCRELLWIVEAGDAKVVDGPLPTLEMIDKLPGKYLLNPGSRVPNTQPQYEEDYEKWVSDLTKSGG